MTRYLIIGGGAAGTTAAENIRSLDRSRQITIVTEEDFPFYYRIRLNDYIRGDITKKELLGKQEDWHKKHNIQIRLHTRITGADLKSRTVTMEGKETLSFDHLLIAAGSHSFIPPIKGFAKTGVFALRSLRDAHLISSYAAKIKDIVLIGGGLLGLETGNALLKPGKTITIVEFFPRLLPRQLDTEGAQRLQAIMEKMGFVFRLGAKTQEIAGDDKVKSVILENGEELPAEMVVISAGVRPNIDLADPLSLDHDRGIQVNDRMETNQPGIYAAGDVAEHRGKLYGIWPAALQQGETAGINMAGGNKTYKGTPMAATLKVVGIDLASAGDIDAENKFESRVLTKDNIYKKIVIQDGRIIGCIMLGKTQGFPQLAKAILEKQEVSRIEEKLLSVS